MYRRLRSRSVHFFVTCEKRTAAQWRLPEKEMFRPQEKSEIGIAQRFSSCKYPESTDPDLSLLYILTLGTCGKFARINNFLVLGVCFPQTCTNVGHMFAASRSRLHYY